MALQSLDFTGLKRGAVTKADPMKRGLRLKIDPITKPTASPSYNGRPDEKGTETWDCQLAIDN